MGAVTVSTASNLAVRWYWATVGIVLSIGFLINYFIVTNVPAEVVTSINIWALLIGYFVCCIAGISLSAFSKNPLISFIGFLLVVVPIGFVITPFIQSVDPNIVANAALFTALLTIIMGAGGFLFPSLFKSLGGILFWALLAAIVVEVILLFMGVKQSFMDYIVALIFLGFIGYDFAEAQDDEPTMDAAVDRAVALYLDIINLFLRVLSIMASSDD
jgi:FtsH-binding integral membrane protein